MPDFDEPKRGGGPGKRAEMIDAAGDRGKKSRLLRGITDQRIDRKQPLY